jgi:hypothetical protein
MGKFRMRWTGVVARVGEKRNADGLFLERLEREMSLERPNIGGWIVLRWIF